MSGASDDDDRGVCFCGKPLVMSGGGVCAGCELLPMNCLTKGGCLHPDDGDTGDRKPRAFTRGKPRDPASTERRHFEGRDDERLIAHQATPGIVEVLKDVFDLEPISREEYREGERGAMRTDPPEGKA